MITSIDQVVEEVRKGNFTNIAKLFLNDYVEYDANTILAIIKGCSINKDMKVLYLIFLEVSKVFNTPAEDFNIDDLRRAYFKFNSLRLEDADKDKEFFEKWFKLQIQKQRYNGLMIKIFDVAYNVYCQNSDLYAAEIIEYMCTSKNVEFRKYALLNMENVARFLSDENEEIASIAKEINDFKETYEQLPLDAKLLIDLLETALTTRIINYKFDSNNCLFQMHSDLFSSPLYSDTLPKYYFEMPNHKMIAYKIYEAIIKKEVEFKEGKTPIFYTNLSSNNPRTL